MSAGGVNDGARIPVLYLAPWVDYGGSDKGTIDWFRWMDRDRFELSLICTQPSANRRLAEVEPYARETWALPELMTGERFPQFIFDFIATRGIELVHVMNSRLAYDLLPDLASLPRPPRVVVQLHVEEETRDGYVRYVATRYGNVVDAFSITSRQLAAAMAEYQVPSDKLEVIYTGVDAEEEFSPDRVAPIAGLESDVVNVLYPGRLCAQKDPRLMVEVAAALKAARGGGFCIHVVGEGELEEAVRDAVRARDLEDHVRFHPATHEIARWYAACDLLLMTSVFEGVPYVVYEAMAMGLPIVAPALPGNVELLGEEGGGLITPRDDVSSYVARLCELIDDCARRRDAGARLRERARTELSLRAMADAHATLYETLVSPQRAVATAPSAAPATAPAPLRFHSRPLRGTPLVSVVVPCFNHGRFLRGCIDSIRRQTYPAIETIVVDDGSTDRETRAVLDELEAGGGVRVIRQAVNGGPSIARNTAIAVAEGRYVLPVDADNVLIEDAVERLVGQLREAGEEVGFIYPNLQFFGNRDDYFEPPDYNGFQLLHGNYCDTCSLFDREIFDAGLRFAEDITLGHEDWDFVLALAERGVRGERARGRTLLYRKHGFSRADMVDHAQNPFHEHVAERHPLLYGAQEHEHPFVTAKARWSPHVSLIALEPLAEAPAQLVRQSCQDFELIAFADFHVPSPRCGPWLERLPAALAPDQAGRLDTALEKARGKVIVVTRGDGAELLRGPDFVEKLVRLFEEDEALDGVALVDAPAAGHAWRPMRAGEDVGDGPHTVAWRWRGECLNAPEDDVVAGIAHSVAAHGGTLDWRHHAGPAVPGETAPARMLTARGGVRRRRGWRMHEPRGDWPAILPRLDRPVRRWQLTPTWIPPLVTLLCRHREIGGERRVMNNVRDAPPGYELEHVLGGVKTLPFQGTARLLAVGPEPRYVVEPDGATVAIEDGELLGHLESAAFPLLYPVFLARHPRTGHELLIAGPDDNLAGTVESIAVVGHVEPYPIEPRRADAGDQTLGFVGVVRAVDRRARRHRYGFGQLPAGDLAGELGALIDRPYLETEPVWLTSSGYVVTASYRPRPAQVDLARAAKWTLAPFRWRGSWGLDARARGSARRLLDGTGALLQRNGNGAAMPPAAAPVGYLLREPGRGRVALYAAVHPVTHDQLLTTCPREATHMGYEDCTAIGHLLARAPVTGGLGTRPVAIPWASRFGSQATIA